MTCVTGMTLTPGGSFLTWMKRMWRKLRGGATPYCFSACCACQLGPVRLYWHRYICQLLWCLFLLSACSREERRWMEKQNRAVRQKRKKEETVRLRALVGMSWPRPLPSEPWVRGSCLLLQTQHTHWTHGSRSSKTKKGLRKRLGRKRGQRQRGKKHWRERG